MTDMPFLAKLFWGAVETVRVDLCGVIEAREALVGVPGLMAVRTRSRLDGEATRLQVVLAEIKVETGNLVKRRASESVRRHQEMWT